MTTQKNTLTVNIEDMKPGDTTRYHNHPVTIIGEATYGTDRFGRTDVRYMARAEDGREGLIIFGKGINWTVTRDS